MDVISELLGVPEADRDEARRLADLTVHREDGVRDVPEDGMTAAFELIEYFSALVKERRKTPADDLTSALTLIENDGDRLSDEEINAFLFLMVVAGNETTTKLLGNALFHLSANPEQQKEVYAEPEDLVSDWIEETLRHDTSSQMLARYVIDDVELGGQTVPAGSKLLVLLGSANRDEDVFSHPDVFDIHRAEGRARPEPELRHGSPLLPRRPPRPAGGEGRARRADAPYVHVHRCMPIAPYACTPPACVASATFPMTFTEVSS